MAMTLPGWAENVSARMRALGTVRWRSAFTVVERMRGRSGDDLVRASRASVVMRWAETAPAGDTRS